MKSRDVLALEKQRFKDRKSDELKPLSPEALEMLGRVVKQGKPKKVKKPSTVIGIEERKAFYASWKWRKARMRVLLKYGHRCQSCGATPSQQTVSGANVRIVVDHIKPLATNWDLRLEPQNLQVLCDECNMGKGRWDTTDYRGRKG